MIRLLTATLLSGVALSSLPASASAQFGRNKVQFDDFTFQVMESDHFDWHFYASEAEAVADVARMGERWYERFARTFQHEFEETKPVILYADHPDFQQTNTLQGFVGEGTGGVTESMKNRVIMPITGSYWDTDHVLGHEIVHAFQYNIAQARPGGFQGLSTLPLWLIEGMAEYLSVGRDDPLTAMWIRDAIRRDDLPTIEQLTRDSRFFPYRFGQALWAYIGGRYGDDAVIEIYRRSLRVGFEGAINQVIGMGTDTLSVRWKEQVAREYLPLMEGRAAPSEQGRLLLAPSTGSGSVNTSPALSPDGRYVVFLSEKDLFSIDLYMADAATGEIIRKLSSANSDPHIDAIRYIDSSGTWSPDSRSFAYVVIAEGDNQLVIVDSGSGEVTHRIGFEAEGIGALANPAWSPDGRYIAFSGSVGGISDLFIYDLEGQATVRLTDDKYADLQPTWSPDGRTLAFTSDRGPETNFESLTYSRFQLATIDVATRAVRAVPIFGNVKHINPQYSADGSRLYFISDQDGFSNIYELTLATSIVRRITNVDTGVSGHTYLAPAMSVSASGLAAYTVFDSLEFHVYALEIDDNAPTVTIVEQPELQVARRLPPLDPDRFSRVATYLADANTGLLPAGAFEPTEAEEYGSGLSLDYLGQPSIGVGTDSYGGYVGGGTSLFFSDMLGDKSLSVAVQAQGSFKDIGGTAFYSDLSDRWNWGVGGGRIPYLIPYVGYGDINDPDCAADRLCAGVLEWTYYRQYVTTAVGQVSYPFSSTQRLDFGLGATRYSYDIEVDKLLLDGSGRAYGQVRESRDSPDPLNMFSGSAAIIGDNSFFGFVSPIRGSRYRFEVEQTFGTMDFTTVVADYRRYFAPTLNLTVALRALHFGRYGVANTQSGQGFLGGGPLTPLFLGYETLVRGYAWESVDVTECTGATSVSSCPTVDRLVGNRIAVGGLEARIPLLGVEQYGLINFPFVPTELVFFTDAGLAWSCTSSSPTCEAPSLEWSRSGSERVPVVSSGVSARMNVLGIVILEAYYAYPWQRPEKGWHWGFQIAPGW
ncbi:MAG: peptidase S9 [Gemmatimonadetes bacterium]|nr:peptidase S9 [Gemmatimonadota bacterium]